MVISRRSLLGGFAGVVAGLGPVLAEAPRNSPRPDPRPLSRGAGLSPAGGTRVVAASASDLVAAAKLGGEVAYVVADAKTGLVLETMAPEAPLPPASTAKAMTALYALEHLAPDQHFQTRLLATGPVSGGVIRGDLVLAGGGDPTLSTDDLAALARALRGQGITAVEGRFLLWGGALPYAAEIAGGQPVHVGYNPAVSGLNLNYNRVHFEWRRASGGYSLALDARSATRTPKVYTARVQLAQRARPLFTYAAEGGREEWTVARDSLGNGGSRWLPVRMPELYAGDVFQTLARAEGLALPAPEIARRLPAGTVLASHSSVPLREMLRDMLRFSTNITAEAIGLATTLARGGLGAGGGGIAASAGAMSGWLADRSGGALSAGGTLRAAAGGAARFTDHSGLGADARVSTSGMVAALLRLGPGVGLRGILRDIPMRDASGKEVTGHPVKVRAKTGTLNFVSTLAGYMTAPDGTELAFAIFTGDVARRAALGPAEAAEGSAAWVRRSKVMQQNLIERWAAVYG